MTEHASSPRVGELEVRQLSAVTLRSPLQVETALSLWLVPETAIFRWDGYSVSKQGLVSLKSLAVGPTKRSFTWLTFVGPAASGL